MFSIKVKRLHEKAKIPVRAHHDDAGMDIFSCGEHLVPARQTIKIPTGLAFELPEGYVGLIWDKGSVSSKGIKTLGGVIDAGYRGELVIVVHNLQDAPYTFAHGDKVAQMLIQKVEFPEIIEAETLSESRRGTGGFGSTGK
jgi:dUTP pyrophosphatase